MARNQYAEQTAEPTGARHSSPGAPLGSSPGAPVGPSTAQPPTGSQPVIGDAQTTAILVAVEQQLTRYFGAMAARVDAVQQASDAGTSELINHFQQQIDVLRSDLDRAQQANENYELALQTALEERLTEFAANQHWRFGEVEGRLERVSEEISLGLPTQFEAATAPMRQRFDRTTELLASRIEELQKAARRFDEQSSALVQHVNDNTASLSRRMDETGRAFNGQLDERTLALSTRVDDATAGMRQHVADQVTTFAKKLEDSDNRFVDRMLSMEERVNEQTGVRLAGVEATIGRISTGIDEAIVAVSHRVIELENNNLALLNQIEQIAEQMAKVDEEAIGQLRDQMSSAVGESMLVRIELERVASSTGEQFDRISVRMAEIAAQIADSDLDVSTAVQLERLEEIERALIELDPSQFVRKNELAGNDASPSTDSASSSPQQTPSHANPTESNLSSW